VLDHHGDRASALQAYQAFAQRLAAEYEVEPAAETQALVAAVRARERAAPAVPLPAVDLLARLQAGLAGRYRIERELARGRTATGNCRSARRSPLRATWPTRWATPTAWA